MYRPFFTESDLLLLTGYAILSNRMDLSHRSNKQ